MVPINMRDPFMKDPFFSSTWEEFDKIKHDMMERSKNFWEKVDKDFTNFEDTVKTTHDQMDRQMAPFRPQLPRWAIPDEVKDRWAPMLPQDSQEVCYVIIALLMLLLLLFGIIVDNVVKTT